MCVAARVLALFFALPLALLPVRSDAEEVVMMPVANAMNAPEAAAVLDGSVKFYFGSKPPIPVLQSFGTFVTNPKTNAFAKTEGDACERVFLSALISLQERARSVGANAVINIESYYKKHVVSSENAFECHKGFLMAGVALRGDVVRLASH